jgi:hypothetical protein
MPTTTHGTRRPRPMNVHVMRASKAEAKYRALTGVPFLEPEVLAPGIAPTPVHDLVFHGGKTIAALTFTNFYVGGSAWKQSDIQNIDGALSAAMSDPHLNNVMAQYFGATPPTSAFTPSRVLPGTVPSRTSQGDIEQVVASLQAEGAFAAFDLGATVFNFMLPSGTILSDNPAPGGAEVTPKVARSAGVPEEEESDSLNGLGGYHGSVQTGGTTIYYAVGVYSETSGGQTNGIPVFDQPWKNVVATFYHELNEARTDPDVEVVITGGSPTLLGWTSRQGEECGDFPVFEANPLSLVFREVPVAGGTVPVQFMYSNYVHGPEGPVLQPDPASKHKAHHRKA